MGWVWPEAGVEGGPSVVAPDVRPLVASDMGALQAFLSGLSYGARYFRFGRGDIVLAADQLYALCTPDPREGASYGAFVTDRTRADMVGLAGYCVGGEPRACEFALVVADAWQGRGIGRRLIATLADDARRRGLWRLTGRVLASNRRMLDCARRFGFRVEPWDGSAVVMRVTLALVPTLPPIGAAARPPVVPAQVGDSQV
ncbi:GNAT family N-acetyltransferase [Pseudothauera hydrothermalis]|uniref:GNAT family N-acetyltransferase n=1 Tax=Pseudothauera hydrothermalis TaxID=2184083 RepID=UPI000E09B0B9|nr:GNAT family N-acetyltransferase [Pseudothauera hydrothermalis]